MRVTDRLVQNSYLSNLNSIKSDINTLAEQMTSQSTINRPSDNSLGTSRLLSLNSQASDIETYLSNISNSIGFVDSTISSLEGIQSQITNALTDLTSVMNGTLAEDDYATYAENLQTYLDAIVDYANSKYDDRYLFGGTDYSQDPYSYDGTQYVQNTTDTSGEITVKISSSMSQQINITGDEVFGTIDGTDIFNQLQSIIDDLNNGILPDSSDIESIEDFNDSVTDLISSAGNISVRLEDTQTMLEAQQIDVEELISDISDIDMTQAAVDYESLSYALEVTYQVSSMILPQSLLDYL